jgi:hypothetical protein
MSAGCDDVGPEVNQRLSDGRQHGEERRSPGLDDDQRVPRGSPSTGDEIASLIDRQLIEDMSDNHQIMERPVVGRGQILLELQNRDIMCAV